MQKDSYGCLKAIMSYLLTYNIYQQEKGGKSIE